MNNRLIQITTAIFVFFAPTLAPAATEPVLALKGLDPVALGAGSETAGREEFTITKGRYRYQFASAENRQRFEAAPDRHGIQFDGYCMKMGPLSGRGSVERWFVHEGRIYLFASEGCRTSFKAAPESFIDRADAPPTGNDAERKRGRELLELAARGFGGAAKLDALRNVQVESRLLYVQGGKDYEYPRTQTLGRPGQLRVETAWGTNSTYGHTMSRATSIELSPKGADPMAPDVREFVTRDLYRNPLALVRARGEAGLLTFAVGRGEVDGSPVEFVKVGFHGATTTLGVDTTTGRVRQAAYRGRAAATMGDVIVSYSDFREVDGGLLMPFGLAFAYNGKPSTQPKVTTVAVRANVPLAADFFPKSD